MHTRILVQFLKEKSQPKTTNFKNWEKKKYTGKKKIFGTELSYIKYRSQVTGHIFELGLDYGKPSVTCTLQNLTKAELDILYDPLKNSEDEHGWRMFSCRMPAGKFPGDILPEDILTDIRFDLDSLPDLKIFSEKVSMIFKDSSFTEVVLPDILNEINSSFKEQEFHMYNLTESLYEGNRSVYDECQEELEWNEEGGELLILWINHFIQQQRLVDAIMLCHVVPKKEYHFDTAQKIAMELLMQMQSIHDMNQSKEKIILPLGEHGANLEYLELIYKFASQKADKSKALDDIRYAMRALSELFGHSGLDCPVSSVYQLNQTNLLIEYAREARKLQEDNKRLKLENESLSSQFKGSELKRSSINTQGIFKTNKAIKLIDTQEMRPRSKSLS